MARPIWNGTISFGLLQVPVQLMPAERRTDLRFHMLDSRDRQRVRYERVNAETGEEVPWKDVVKAFEYSKGSYVVLEDEDIRKAAPESKESVDIEAFVDPAQIDPRYFERPYYLVPAKKAEKAYVLLRETLKDQDKAGLARVVIRTREYLALVLPMDAALVLHLLRYPKEIIDVDEYTFPQGSLRSYKIAPRELEMASQLVASMVTPWTPDDYRNEFQERLAAVIRERTRKKTRGKAQAAEKPAPELATGKVVDFMALLKKSIAENKRTPAGKTAGKTKAASAKAPRKAAAAKKTATRKGPPRKRAG